MQVLFAETPSAERRSYRCEDHKNARKGRAAMSATPRILTTTVGSYPVPDWLGALPATK